MGKVIRRGVQGRRRVQSRSRARQVDPQPRQKRVGDRFATSGEILLKGRGAEGESPWS